MLHFAMMITPTYTPPFWLNNGLIMTLYTALYAHKTWENTTTLPEPVYREQIFTGANNVPIFGIVAIPENPIGTIIATYGITGDLDNQWFLRLLGRKAYNLGYAVILFDWRAHGKTALLSPTLTSDGLYEGEDFVRIASQGKKIGCPAPFWFTSYSLGGQLALWGIKISQDVNLCRELGLDSSEIAGGAVICPTLESNLSLSYLVKHPTGKYLERAIAKNLKNLAYKIHDVHPNDIAPDAIERANTIWGFDHELVINKLGFPSVESYYQASSSLYILPSIQKPTLIIYAEDDPLFYPGLIPELKKICQTNQHLKLILTKHGGHVGYISSKYCQKQFNDPDIWWGWNRVLEEFNN